MWGKDANTLESARREFLGRLRMEDRRAPAPRVVRSQEELQAEADRLMALSWGPVKRGPVS